MDNELILFDRINIIHDVIQKYGEDKFYISFSGGKDSTVLHHLVDEAIPGNKIPHKCNTLEERLFFDGILAIVDTQPKVNEWIPVEERLPEESLNSVIGWDA